MNVIEVIPIKKGVMKSSLSYFTSQDLPIGSIVKVSIRNKIVKGIVISKKDIGEIKSDIKKAKFTLKKIENVKATNFFNKEFLISIENTANYFIGNVGNTFNLIVPDYFLENIDKLKTKKIEIKERQSKTFVVEGQKDDRYTFWKGLIRQEFARKKSLVFVLPNNQEAINTFNTIKKGIEKYVFILNGNQTKKEIIKNFNDAQNTDHPIVMVCTYAFLSFNRDDIETYVLEKERNRSYKLQKRPYVDIRYFVNEYTKNLNADLYISDEKVRVETLYKKIKREIKEINIYKDNLNIECEIKLIDMKFKTDTDIKETRIISQYTEEIIKKAIENSEKVFIYSTRRGTSPITLCEDCQNIVICNKCNSPVVLHKNFFMCHRCGERRSAEEYCAKCGSWKLKAFGIGIDLVYEKIKEIFPDIPLFKIDSDTTKSDKDIKEIISKWNENKMGVLLGTEMVIQYIDNKVQYSSVIGIDSLLSMPDFRIEERIVTILQNIKSITEKCMVIETRKIEERAFEYFKDNNIDEFYKNILEEREMVGYPPYKTLIKITIAGKRSEIAKEMEELRNILGEINIDIFPAFTRNKNGEEVLHGLIKLENTVWPNEELLFKLRNLSPAISINTDPESLL